MLNQTSTTKAIFTNVDLFVVVVFIIEFVVALIMDESWEYMEHLIQDKTSKSSLSKFQRLGWIKQARVELDVVLFQRLSWV